MIKLTVYYKIHHPSHPPLGGRGMVKIILQLGKICEKYNLKLKDPKPLTYYNGWLSGFFDTDGSIYLNDASGQIFITATQKNRFILDILVELYGGTIYPMVKQGAFQWTC